MNFLFSIILGGIAGYIASRVMGAHHSALINIVIGIVGGLLGGFIARQFLGNRSENEGLIMHLLISVAGAVILLFIGRLL
jgi:uncharacterized membrane protein YeaQ/YmgE (transglycosylase-associated protein family)